MMSRLGTVLVGVGLGLAVGACAASDGAPPDLGPDAGPGTPAPDAAPGAMPDAGLPACEPVAEVEQACDGVDDDCNGIVDDVDVGADGFCDCYRVGILGAPTLTATSDFDAWLSQTGTSVIRFGTDATQEITEALLAPFDIVIVDRLTRTYSAAEATILRDYVKRGRGLVALAGYENVAADRDAQNSLARAAGARAVAPLYSEPNADATDHPIATGVSGVEFYGGWSIEAVGTEPAGDAVLATPGSTAALAVAKEYGAGRAFLHGDEWILFHGDWQNPQGMTTLWRNILRWVAPASACSRRE